MGAGTKIIPRELHGIYEDIKTLNWGKEGAKRSTSSQTYKKTRTRLAQKSLVKERHL